MTDLRQEFWFPEPAIEIMKLKVQQSYLPLNVLETGMGGSTIYLSKWCNLVSIEHEQKWYDEISAFLKKGTGSLNLVLRLCERPYHTEISKLNDDWFDIIIIDGRDRVKCIEAAIPKLKKEGWLVLDNSERPYYQKGIDLMKDWNRIDCKQNRPDKNGFTYPDWKLTIFFKP